MDIEKLIERLRNAAGGPGGGAMKKENRPRRGGEKTSILLVWAGT